MAGVQTARSPIAVSHAGGLGSLPCAMLSSGRDPQRARPRSRAQTDKAFNVNFFCHTPADPDADRERAWRASLTPYYAELEREPPSGPPPARAPFDADAARSSKRSGRRSSAFTSACPSTPLLQRVRATGAKILSSATTVDEARWLESKGVDAIIAQGVEAGGHRGMFLSEDLTMQVGDARAGAADRPGGAGTGDRRRRNRGCRRVCAPLSHSAPWRRRSAPPISSARKRRRAPCIDRRLSSDAARHTALTNLFSGRPARGIVNRVMRELGAIRPDIPRFPLASAALHPLRAAAEAKGRGDFSPLWAGQNTTGCQAIPAGDLTRRLAP